jgi:phospholipase/carboxylesterase
MPEILDCIEIQTGPQPAYSVIWMHGLGADGNDFVPLVHEMNLKGLPDIRFVFPNAPRMPVTINGGFAMRAWYDILGADLVRQEDEVGLRTSCARITTLIEREKTRGIPSEKILLAGFSQGCAMALMTAVRYKEKLAGVIALSGYLPLLGTTAAEHTRANLDTPFFIAHGTGDPVVIMARGTATRDALQQLGYQVQWHEYPMPHSVCAEEIEDIAEYLRSVLGA